ASCSSAAGSAAGAEDGSAAMPEEAQRRAGRASTISFTMTPLARGRTLGPAAGHPFIQGNLEREITGLGEVSAQERGVQNEEEWRGAGPRRRGGGGIRHGVF